MLFIVMLQMTHLSADLVQLKIRICVRKNLKCAKVKGPTHVFTGMRREIHDGRKYVKYIRSKIYELFRCLTAPFVSFFRFS